MKIEYKYGFIIGFGVSVWILAEYLLGFHTSRLEIGEYSGYGAIIIPLIAFYFGIKEKRDKDYKGSMTYWQGVKSGMMISLVAAVIIAVFWYIYPAFINPQWFDIGFEFERSRLMKIGLSEDEIVAQLEVLAPLYTTPIQISIAFIGTIIQSFIISLIMSAFLKKKKVAGNVGTGS